MQINQVNLIINIPVEFLLEMFRDLKEYQEIAKIYTDKVSKPENLDEKSKRWWCSSTEVHN